ncbi:sulfate reduction electron transfer complex DsrMKJOP subunit DsrO [Candidatus Parabeggiatoa sp. HSG14]|uniref:sulfate reduction electron transfer complex DsrMKJOP subunit DsrO n=1 Tax=Candidatus Parabeggiatoa sp. HSG14 TaxID=3055593 RepID=UPI0025A7F221|nr:4Fe-4S dicluster domain-containing protein [Thiotrichales bacterium HSG14]
MNEEISPTPNRRDFLKTTAIVAGITVAPGVLLYGVSQAKSPDDQTITAKKRWGMLIDTNKCVQGCNECVNACITEHGISENVRPDITSQWIRKVGLRDKQTGKEYSLPLFCQHCEHPPCVDVCPTGASFKRVDGIVLVDKHICIGCRYCMMACPYKARSFVHETLKNQKPHSPRGKGTVEACTFCVHRIDKGQSPACVAACQKSGHKAMLFGDIKDPNSEISKKLSHVSSTALRPDMRLNPGIRYQGL